MNNVTTLTRQLMPSVWRLVMSFDSDEGQNEDVYLAVFELIQILCGDAKAEKFADAVKATDGSFYFRDGTDVWELKKDLGLDLPGPK